MRIKAKITDTFSPYLDPSPWFDFYDSFKARGATSLALAVTLNFALFFALTTHMPLIDLEIEEPDIIPVQIIITAAKPEVEEEPAPPEPAPEPVIRPVIPAPAPKPTPKPQPVAPPPPPPPAPTPEPEPVVEPTPAPAVIIAPEILAAPLPEPEPEAIAEPIPEIIIEPLPEPIILPTPEPTIEPEPLPEIEPLPEPVPLPEPLRQIEIEMFEPAPLYEPLPEIDIFEPEPLPEIIPEPILESILEPLPEPVPEPKLDFNALEPAPIIEIGPPVPIEAPVLEEIILDAAPGAIIEELPLIELPPELILPTPEPEPEAPIDIGPSVVPDLEPEIIPEAEDVVVSTEAIEPELEIIETAPIETAPLKTAPILTDAPKILADDDAPDSQAERSRAVSEDQADTGRSPAASGGGAYKTPTLGGGGGGAIIPNIATAPPPGGTRRPGLGANGWNLNPGAQADPTRGGVGGIVLDMRCREAGRTHADCPEYIRKITGRDASGYESLGTQQNSRINGTTVNIPGGSAPRRTGASPDLPAIGGGYGSSSAPGGGWTSETRGLPSTSVIDDADFGRTFRTTPLGGAGEGERLRDLFNNQQPLPAITLDPNVDISPVDEANDDDSTKSKWSLE